MKNLKKIVLLTLSILMLVSVSVPIVYATDNIVWADSSSSDATDVTWKETNDTVYATTGVNVRKGPSTDFLIVGGLAKGTSTTRIAKGSNGWSKVKYGNGTYYVCSKYLTTSSDILEIGDVNRTAYTTTTVNVRKGPSLDYIVAYTVPKGTEVIEITRYESGWSKVCYNGGTYYIFNKYLEPSPKEVTWTDVDEYVYATTNVNMRQGYSTETKILGYVKTGAQVKRIAIGDNGWSKCVVDDQTVYICSKYLTTTDPMQDITMTPVNDIVYANTNVNIRSGPSLDYEVIGVLVRGKSVKRTAICDNGWCEVNINGQKAYIYGFYLTN
ncbi:MAG: SH3 domain-containing protein [Acutalibacteraceae bacterium]|nr:SH3 domain-containing protein [Acutalibacteraceae bacterium]